MYKQFGEITIDHRASPGIPRELALWAGYDPDYCGEGKVYEQATMACAHCPNIVLKNPFRQRARHSCAKCSHRYICDVCAFRATLPDYSHTPFEKVIDQHLTAVANGSPPALLLGDK